MSLDRLTITWTLPEFTNVMSEDSADVTILYLLHVTSETPAAELPALSSSAMVSYDLL